jgi:hypothetical protein
LISRITSFFSESFTPKIEALRSFETSVSIYKSSSNIPQDLNVYQHRSENFKSRTVEHVGYFPRSSTTGLSCQTANAICLQQTFISARSLSHSKLERASCCCDGELFNVE